MIKFLRELSAVLLIAFFAAPFAMTQTIVPRGSYVSGGQVLPAAPSGGTASFAKVLVGDGSATAPSYTFTNETGTGFYRVGSGLLGVAISGAASMRFATDGSLTNSGGDAILKLSSTNGSVSLTAGGTNQNITLTPSGTGVVFVSKAVRIDRAASVAATSNSLHVINNVATDGIRYVRDSVGSITMGYSSVAVLGTDTTALTFKTGLTNGDPSTGTEQGRFNGSNLLLGTTLDSANGRLQLKSGTTSADGIGFGTDTPLYRTAAGVLKLDGATNAAMEFDGSAAGTQAFTFRQSGTIVGQIGMFGGTSLLLKTATGTTALTLDASQNATFAGHVIAGTNSALGFYGRSSIGSSGNGIITLFNNALTDFSRLTFGGTTSSFPALKRSGADLQCRDATDAAFASFWASVHIATGAAASAGAGTVTYGGTTATTVGAAGGASALPATPLGYIIINVGGTTAKIPYYNN